MELSIIEIAGILFKRIWIIMLCTILGLSGAFLFSSFFITPTYTSSCQMYVNPGADESADANNNAANYADLQYAQRLVESYLFILQTDVFLKDVAADTGLPYTSGRIHSMLELKPISNTEFFEVKVNSKSPLDSYKIVNSIIKLAPAEIIRIKESDSVKIISPAVLSNVPTAPNIPLITVIGAVLGFVVAIGIAILIEVLDIRVKSEEDLASHYTLPVLGSIPKYNED
ncbi:MAG: YveK family protein [Saccharofermentanales bacterium]